MAVLGGVKTQSFDEGPSIGGGRGLLGNVEGDYPVAALRRAETKQNLDGLGKHAHEQELFIWHKNVRGLMSEERLLELIAELDSLDWDFFFVERDVAGMRKGTLHAPRWPCFLCFWRN